MLSLLLLLLSVGIGAANAAGCLVFGPQYQLQSDTVEWQMRAHIGERCVRGVRFKLVANPVLKIISPPRFGELTLQGPSFSYTAGANFQEEDSVTVEVSGSIKRVIGTSTISVVVSNIDAPPVRGPPASGLPIPPPAPPAPPVKNIAPSDPSLPPCPVWDWSKGAPPPMRRPFDKSKLYCPPPPFHPPNPPVGCNCPNGQ